jgi:hypothetical protein
MLRSMSVDMAVWEGDRPPDDEAGQVFEALYDRYIDREYPTEPTAKIKEFVEALTTRFPDLDALGDDEVDDSPWADSPLLANASGPLIYFGMVTNEAAQQAWELAQATATRLGLIAFDPQSGRFA